MANKKHDSTVNRTRVLTVLMSHSTIKLWNPKIGKLRGGKTMLLVRIELTTLCLLNTRSTTELKKRSLKLFVCYIWVYTIKSLNAFDSRRYISVTKKRFIMPYQLVTILHYYNT